MSGDDIPVAGDLSVLGIIEQAGNGLNQARRTVTRLVQRVDRTKSWEV